MIRWFRKPRRPSMCRPGFTLPGLAAGMAAAILLAAAAPAPPVESVRVTAGPVRATPPYVQVELVAESTWVLRAGTANVLAVLTAEGWVVIDTGTRAEALALRSEMQRLATRPIVAVFNTHFHDDHSGGNLIYRAMGVPIHASRRTQRLERDIRARLAGGAPREIARLDSCAAAIPAGDDRDRILAFYEFLARWWREGAAEAARDPQFVVPADRPFERRVRLVVGGLGFEARAFARGAHTDGDAVVAIPRRRVVAIGDILIRGGAPWADQFMGGGSIEGIVAAQDTLAAWLAAGFGVAGARAGAADTTWRLVPGHGTAMRVGELASDRRALRELRACAHQAFSAGRAPATAAADCAGVGFPGETASYAVWLFDEEWRRAAAPARSRTPRRLTKP